MRVMLVRTYRRLFRHEDWNIGIVPEPITSFLDQSARHIVNWFPRFEEDKFLADPFGIARRGKIYVFCEEYDCRTLKGRIVCIDVNAEGSPSRPTIAIELPSHMSYPFLFEYGGELYCVPETAQAREVCLYKNVDFPCGWKKVGPLVGDFAGRDGTLFAYEDAWWLSCTGGNGEISRELYLWYSSSPLGPWKPHAANPVKRDLGSSRPAGTPFVHQGQLFRPAQDCSKTYGGRIVINRVNKLSPSEFVEEKASVVEPFSNGPYREGVHTISAAGNATLVDGKRHMFRSKMFKSNLKGIIASMIRD
jgi:hypothetical protein